MVNYELIDMIMETNEHLKLPFTRKDVEDLFDYIPQNKIDAIREGFELTDGNPMGRMQLVHTVGKFAFDLKNFLEIEQRWLNDEGFSAGVDKDGQIVLWNKDDPNDKIKMGYHEGEPK
jgi:hypothetical protein